MPPGVAGFGKEFMEQTTVTDVNTANPLLTREMPVPFDSIKADMVEPAIQKLIDQSREALSKVASGRDSQDLFGYSAGSGSASRSLWTSQSARSGIWRV